MKFQLLLILCIILGLMSNCSFIKQIGRASQYENAELTCIDQTLIGLGSKTMFKVQGNKFICTFEKHNILGGRPIDTIKVGSFSNSSWAKIDKILHACPKEVYNANEGVRGGVIQLITVKIRHEKECNFILRNGHDDKATDIFNVLNEYLDSYEFKTMKGLEGIY